MYKVQGVEAADEVNFTKRLYNNINDYILDGMSFDIANEVVTL